MAPAERTKFFQSRMTEDELRMLRALSEADGLTASDVVRQLVRREYLARFGDGKSRKAKRAT